MHAILLGAGFSKHAADLPLARELFDFEIAPRNMIETRRLERLRTDKAVWDQSNLASDAGSDAEQFVAWSIRGPERLRMRSIWYITRRLSVPFQDPRVAGAQDHSHFEGGILSVGEPCWAASAQPRSRLRSALDRVSGA